MEDTIWRFGLSTTSKSFQSVIKSFPDLCIDFEEVEEEEDLKADYPCPFCDDDFDLVELCCHIDEEHLYENKSGVCPVCAARIGTDMVGHIISHHGHLVKSLHRLKLHKGDSDSTLSFLKKELQDDYLNSLISSKSPAISSKPSSDPLLSFVANVSASATFDNVEPRSSPEGTREEKTSAESLERNLGLSYEEQSEKTKRSEYVRGMMLSAIFGEV